MQTRFKAKNCATEKKTRLNPTEAVIRTAAVWDKRNFISQTSYTA